MIDAYSADLGFMRDPPVETPRPRRPRTAGRGAFAVVRLTRRQAEALDIVRCACGHRTNNHFSHGKRPCAACDCQHLDPRIVLP